MIDDSSQKPVTPAFPAAPKHSEASTDIRASAEEVDAQGVIQRRPEQQ